MLVHVSHVSCVLNFWFLFIFIMYLEYHCFKCVFVFYSLIYFIIDVLITVDSGLRGS